MSQTQKVSLVLLLVSVLGLLFYQGGEGEVPDPPPDPGSMVVVIVHEAEDKTAEQEQVFDGLRDFYKTNDLQWRIADKDLKNSQGETPNWLKKALSLLEERGVALPAILIYIPSDESSSGVVYAAEPLPANAANAIQLIKKYHGG